MQLIRDFKDFDKSMLDESKPLMVDSETMLDPGISNGAFYGAVRLIQVYQKHWDDAVIFDVLYVDLKAVLDMIKPFHHVYHQAQYDLNTFAVNLGEVYYPKDVDDTRLLAKLKHYDLDSYSFANVAEHLGFEHDLKNSEFGGASNWSGALRDEQLKYAALDVTVLQHMYDSMKDAKETYAYAYQLDIDSLKYSLDYGFRGIALDVDAMIQRKLDYITELEVILNRIKINPRSGPQVQDYLNSDKSDGGTIDLMINFGSEWQADRAKDVKRARQCMKQIGYIENYMEAKDGRLRGFYNPNNSKSGRFSCSGGDRLGYVNLQQVSGALRPVALGYPEDSDKRLVYYDYSGLELRLAVAFCGEPTMTKYIVEGADMHTETAKYIFETDEPTNAQRDRSKAFTFSLIYGASARTVHGTLKRWGASDVTLQEVSALRKKWFEKYPGFVEWHNEIKAKIKADKYVDVHTACHRYARYYKTTEAYNMPIQGTGAECTKHGIRYLYERYPDVKIVCTVHDSIVIEATEETAELWATRLGECMSDGFSFVIQNWKSNEITMPRRDGAKIDNKWTF